MSRRPRRAYRGAAFVVPAPFKPKLESSTDTAFFEDVDDAPGEDFSTKSRRASLLVPDASYGNSLPFVGLSFRYPYPELDFAEVLHHGTHRRYRASGDSMRLMSRLSTDSLLDWSREAMSEAATAAGTAPEAPATRTLPTPSVPLAQSATAPPASASTSATVTPAMPTAKMAAASSLQLASPSPRTMSSAGGSGTASAPLATPHSTTMAEMAAVPAAAAATTAALSQTASATTSGAAAAAASSASATGSEAAATVAAAAKPPAKSSTGSTHCVHFPDALVLLDAAANGELELVAHLVDSGLASVQARNELNSTAVHKAASYGFAPIVEWLLDHGAPLNDQDAQGNTPLHLAAANDMWDAARCLVCHGASVTIRNEDGELALELCTGNPELFAGGPCAAAVTAGPAASFGRSPQPPACTASVVARNCSPRSCCSCCCSCRDFRAHARARDAGGGDCEGCARLLFDVAGLAGAGPTGRVRRSGGAALA